MAIVINGSGTVTGISVGGLPDDIVDSGTLADNAVGLAQMAGGTDGNIITYDTSGNPAVVATGSDGQILTSAGADAVPAFEAAPAGGLSEVDQWRITTDRSTSAGAYTITANWERVDTYFEKIGTGMTESSGIFSFPSNGKWLVTHTLRANQVTGATRYVFFSIDVSVNSGGAYTGVAGGAICIPDAASGTDYSMGTVTHLLDVADKDATLVKFTGSTAAYVVIDGNTSSTETSALFQKVGDT